MIYDFAVALRGWYSARLTAAGRPAFERAHTSDGAVAFDGCPSLVVEQAGIRTGNVAGTALVEPVGEGTTLVADWNVWAWRCVPVVTAGSAGRARIPTSAAVEASAKVILDDREALLAATMAMLTETGTPVDRCRAFAILGVDPVGPEGGLAGSVVRLAVAP